MICPTTSPIVSGVAVVINYLLRNVAAQAAVYGDPEFAQLVIMASARSRVNEFFQYPENTM
jgi:hypothetical protein